jgi:hypothetical protein
LGSATSTYYTRFYWMYSTAPIPTGADVPADQKAGWTSFIKSLAHMTGDLSSMTAPPCKEILLIGVLNFTSFLICTESIRRYINYPDPFYMHR